jgi:uncharacterized protein (AIM24 family)
MTQASGPGHVAFSLDKPGEMLALPLQPGSTVEVREHVFVAASGSVSYGWFDPGVQYTTGAGKEAETHYPLGMFMDRFSAGDQPGLVVLHASGNVLVRTLAADETILVKPAALLLKDPTVAVHLHLDQPGSPYTSWTAGGRYVWVRLYGPGRVAVQTGEKHAHDPAGSITRSSPRTEWRPFVDAAGRTTAPVRWQVLGLDNAPRGPMRLDQARGWGIVGRAAGDPMVWTEGLPEWVPVSAISRCSRCGAEAPAIRTNEISTMGKVLFVVLLLLCFPLSFLAFKLKKRICAACSAEV